jgi:hypothetical protein
MNKKGLSRAGEAGAPHLLKGIVAVRWFMRPINLISDDN